MSELVQVEQVSVDKGPMDVHLTLCSIVRLANGLVMAEAEAGLRQVGAQRVTEGLGVPSISLGGQFHTGMVAAVLA